MHDKKIVFFDIEVSENRIKDIGAFIDKGNEFHSANPYEFQKFIKNAHFAVGHNIFKHDLKYLQNIFDNANVKCFIDTLTLSVLLFPQKPYHKIEKDYKNDTDDINNPLNDSKLSAIRFEDEIDTFSKLDEKLKCIYYTILHEQKEFKDFFIYINYNEISTD
ncbi:MAG: hypothetical protein LBV51_03180, partial [Acholeplasmatales bacterium]|nr:hypothetical protein [Acholeplasmatales bacterium]